MLLIAKSLDELRFEELAALYRYDLEVAGCEDGMCELDDDWFLEKRSQFRTYLSARFFPSPIVCRISDLFMPSGRKMAGTSARLG